MIRKIYTDGFDGFAKRSLGRAEKLDRGERIEPSFSLTFDSPLQMLEVLTAQRVRVLQLARTRTYSITDLAKKLGRDPKSVRRDVNKLEQHGVVRTEYKVNPGHGRVKIVVPIGKRFQLVTSI